MKWVLKGKKNHKSNSFKCAFSGLFNSFKSEKHLIIHFIIAILVIIAGFILKVSNIEWCILVLTISLVISLELVNTAIEHTVDLAMPEIHPIAKLAKDIAAAAVLFSAIGSVVIGIIIFLPKLLEFIK